MPEIINLVVDNRVLLLGLDYLYREHMKDFEVDHLLPYASKLIDQLKLPISTVPVEGYYYESEELTDYFLKVRTLQKENTQIAQTVKHTPEYQILAEVFSSPIYGYSLSHEGFFPQRLNALHYALTATPVNEWSVSTLTTKAQILALENCDISLVGLAASVGDEVVLAALRESVALFSLAAGSCALEDSAYVPPIYQYEWKVDALLEQKANQFITTFNQLTNNTIPVAQAQNAELFYDAWQKNHIEDRCIYIGFNELKEPIEYYHWAVEYNQGGLTVKEFWSNEICTTEKYRESLYDLDDFS